MLVFKLVVVFVGLAIGSFINVLVLREGGGFKGRSRCPHCRHKLVWFDLIPLLSFVWLKRKCRYCLKTISWRYPLVELISGLGFLLIFSLPLSSVLSGWLLVLFSLGLLISVYDLKYLIIPNKFLGLFLFWLVVGSILFWRGAIVIHLLSGIVLASFFLLLLLLSSGQCIGGGDINLAILLGFWAGWPDILVLLMVTYLIGGVVAALLLIYKKARLASHIAFGPFLIIGAFTAFLWSEEIIRWYLGFF